MGSAYPGFGRVMVTMIVVITAMKKLITAVTIPAPHLSTDAEMEDASSKPGSVTMRTTVAMERMKLIVIIQAVRMESLPVETTGVYPRPRSAMESMTVRTIKPVTKQLSAAEQRT